MFARREFQFPSRPPQDNGNAVVLIDKDCEVCKKRDGLLRCSACQCVYYCSREHQAADRSHHKHACVIVKRYRGRFEHQEEVLSREVEHTHVSPGKKGNLFQVAAGRFWDVLETRPYMNARFQFVDATLGLFPSHRHVVQAALDHMLDMLRLCRGDNVGVRDIVPGLYLRLGREQDAFDFVKWYATTGEDSSYDWGNLDLPYLDVRHANVALPWPTNNSLLNLTHISTVFIVKMRLLHDLKSAQNAARALQGFITPEILDLVRGHLVTTDVQVSSKLLLGSIDAVSRDIGILKSQLKDLYKAVDEYNSQFWSSMLYDPEQAARNKHPGYTARMPEEAEVFIGHNLYAWLQTPWAFDTLGAIREAIYGYPLPKLAQLRHTLKGGQSGFNGW